MSIQKKLGALLIVLMMIIGLNACSSSTSQLSNSFKKDTGYGAGLYYRSFGTNDAIKLEQKLNGDCKLEVYSKHMEPERSYYVIGTCLYNNSSSKHKNIDNIEVLKSCACAKEGDGILLFEYDESIKIQRDVNPITMNMVKREILNQEIKANVIKFGERPQEGGIY